MFVLKIPLIGLGFVVWWAVRQVPEEETPDRGDDGGVKRHPMHPREPFPRRPRRGPHGDPPPLPPPRVRTVQARARTYGH
jgi:hypothetical protein